MPLVRRIEQLGEARVAHRQVRRYARGRAVTPHTFYDPELIEARHAGGQDFDGLNAGRRRRMHLELPDERCKGVGTALRVNLDAVVSVLDPARHSV